MPKTLYPAITIDGRQVRIHVARAIRALGHPLPKGAEVHHLDGSKNTDAPLVICQDFRYHMLLHRRMRVVAAGGDPNTQRLCATCKQLVNIDDMGRARSKPDGIGSECLRCKREFAVAATKKRRLTFSGPYDPALLVTTETVQ